MCKQVNGWIMTAGLVWICCTSQAATRNKANNTDNLNLASSWSGGVPGVLDIATWTNTVTAANAVLLGGNLSFMGMAIMNPSGAVAIGASKELVLTTPDTTRTLTLSGTIADNAGGASGVTVTGGGRVSLTGNSTIVVLQS